MARGKSRTRRGCRNDLRALNGLQIVSGTFGNVMLISLLLCLFCDYSLAMRISSHYFASSRGTLITPISSPVFPTSRSYIIANKRAHFFNIWST